MPKERSRSTAAWRPLVASAGWWSAVVVPLAAASLLQTGPEAPSRSVPSPAPAAPVVRPQPLAEDLEVEIEPDPAAELGDPVPESAGVDELTERIANDLDRLVANGPGYTLQFAVVCDEANARVRLAGLADEPEFYLVAAQHDDRACFRLCWGVFESPERAKQAAAAAPPALLAITASPRVLATSEAVP
jgi:hypothetical protein